MTQLWILATGLAICTAANPCLAVGRTTPALSAQSVIVYDQFNRETLLQKNPRHQASIASITKLMTAVVTLDAGLDLQARITITADDVVPQTNASRLPVGTRHTREDLLNLALIPSENRAAHALGRTYPGGMKAFVTAMNAKARQLGMSRTHYVEPTGLSSDNQSTAEDLVKLVDYAYSNYVDIRHISSREQFNAHSQKSGKIDSGYRLAAFNNTNKLTLNQDWHIGLSKTGYISRAGYCLVMQAEIADRPVIIVLLDAADKPSRQNDAARIKRWLEQDVPRPAPAPVTAQPLQPELSCTLSPCQ